MSIATVINGTMTSSLTTGATRPLLKYFHVINQEQLVLPTSIFLAGYTFGPLLFVPLSESFRRKWTMIYAFMLSTVFSMGSALAPNWPAMIVFRLFVGISGACPIAVVGGYVLTSPSFTLRSLTLIGYVRTYTTILKAADELWHYSWPLLLLALYWV
jgi:MFS family permease